MANTRGGKRVGAGRKKSNPPCSRRSFYITDEQVKLLRMWGRGDVSAGLRWVINVAATIIRRVPPPPP